MVLRRKEFETRPFDQNRGMKGNELKLGEEVLLQELFLSENAGTIMQSD
jgi:hypothetical protein